MGAVASAELSRARGVLAKELGRPRELIQVLPVDLGTWEANQLARSTLVTGCESGEDTAA